MAETRSSEGCGHNVIKEHQIRDILKLRASGLSYRKISKIYNVSKTAIRKICIGSSWKNIDRIITENANDSDL